MSSAILLEHMTKNYGRNRGVTGLQLEVGSASVFGFLGPNGAGKTTTIRVLLDLIRPTSGRALVFSLDSRRESMAIRRRCGYLPGELNLYGRLTGDETLRYFANLRGGVYPGSVRTLCERLDFDTGKKVADLSTGNRRKLGLIQALMHRPELLILDEPTAGLDPLVQHEFYHIVEEARQAGQTVFLSSHNLPEVQRVCDRVAFVREGELIAVEDVAVLTGRAVRELEVTFAAPVPAAAFEGVDGVIGVAANGPGLGGASDAGGTRTLRLTVRGSLDATVKVLARYEVGTMTSREPDLEDVFLAFYGDRLGHDGLTASPARKEAGDAA